MARNYKDYRPEEEFVNRSKEIKKILTEEFFVEGSGGAGDKSHSPGSGSHTSHPHSHKTNGHSHGHQAAGKAPAGHQHGMPVEPSESEIEKEDHAYEIENRLKNLLWTVSGDYTLDVKLDISSYDKSKYISMYDAVRQGAFAKYFSMEDLSMYIVKKVFLTAHEKPLMEIAQICTELAAYPHVNKERGGIEEIRRKAYRDMLELQAGRLAYSFFGQAKMSIMKSFLSGNPDLVTARLQSAINRMQAAAGAKETLDIIRIIDAIYNTYIDKSFERTHGSLEDVLAVTIEELQEFNWQDYLNEESLQSTIEQYMKALNSSDIEKVDLRDKKKQAPTDSRTRRVRVMDDEDLKKVYDYVELNYGVSYLSMREQEALNFQLCRGAHEGCSLYYTDGILHNAVKSNYQVKYAEMELSQNKRYYHENHRIIKRNIAQLTDALRKSLVMRNEADVCKSTSGQLIPARLWKLGRTDDNKLFDKVIKKDTSDFVVDILIDSSGSQSGRRKQVAAQGYMISEALSNLGIPHQVMGFCSFWEYTVMHRYRSYDDDRSMNARIFEFKASSNNRDGLAIRATYDTLIKREEPNKVLIILSDGRPNDPKIDGRVGSRTVNLYEGETAIRDTAFEVRRARSLGISVLGVFAGEDEDLGAEKLIFGKDFAFIRDIRNFANVVGTYLKRQIEEDI